MSMLLRMELTMENDEVLVVPGPLVPFLEIGHVWDWNDPERIARFRDISWIDLFYEGEDVPQSFFVPYEDDRPTPVGTPNRLMQTAFDEAGNLWIYIDGDKPPQEGEA